MGTCLCITGRQQIQRRSSVWRLQQLHNYILAKRRLQCRYLPQRFKHVTLATVTAQLPTWQSRAHTLT
jgi:hypothetical protein